MIYLKNNDRFSEALKSLNNEIRRSLPFLKIVNVLDPRSVSFEDLENWLLNDEIEAFDKKDIKEGFLPYLEQEKNEVYAEAFKQILLAMDFLQLDFITVK
jgi:hypothetical protein